MSKDRKSVATKLHLPYVAYLVLTERFNIMVSKSGSANLTVTYSNETQKYLPQNLI